MIMLTSRPWASQNKYYVIKLECGRDFESRLVNGVARPIKGRERQNENEKEISLC